MSHEDLNLEEIRKVLRPTTSREIHEVRAKHPFEEHKELLRSTVQCLRDAEDIPSTTVLLDGRGYVVDLLKGDLFRVKPVYGFVPMGTFPIRWLSE